MPSKQPKVLVSPLNWGLGHATRMIPVIRELLIMGCEVGIAAEGGGLAILKQTFPNLLFVTLPGIRISYPEKGSMTMAIARLFPSILKAIEKEHVALLQLVREHGFTHIISDNRYGLFHPEIPAAIICHQINIQAGKSLRFLEPLLLRLHKNRLQKFDALWIPDLKPPHNLSGKLSEISESDLPHQHIGLLSRFTSLPKPIEKKYHFIALLSGVEPQRTLLENKLQNYFQQCEQPTLIIQGKPETNTTQTVANCTTISTISDEQLLSVLHPETWVICRPGYSSLMDLLTLQHSRIVTIPTPGQTEQEYLAAHIFHIYGIRYIQQNESLPDFATIPNANFVSKPNQELKLVLKEFLKK
jgi:hypothetical protein